MAAATGSIADFVQVLLFKPLAAAVGVGPIFFVFAGVCFAFSLYVAFVVPETKMRSLQEVYQSLKTRAEREEDLQVLKIKEVRILA